MEITRFRNWHWLSVTALLCMLTLFLYSPYAVSADGGGGLPTNTPEPTQTPTQVPTETQTPEPTAESQSSMKAFNSTLAAIQPTATVQSVPQEGQSAKWINYLLYVVILIGVGIIGLIAYIVIRQNRG